MLHVPTVAVTALAAMARHGVVGVDAHFAAVAEECVPPLICFEFSMASGLGYPIDTLVSPLDRVPSIVASQDMCHEPPLHEQHVRTVHSLDRRPVY